MGILAATMGILAATMGILAATMGILLALSYQQVINRFCSTSS